MRAGSRQLHSGCAPRALAGSRLLRHQGGAPWGSGHPRPPEAERRPRSGASRARRARPATPPPAATASANRFWSSPATRHQRGRETLQVGTGDGAVEPVGDTVVSRDRRPSHEPRPWLRQPLRRPVGELPGGGRHLGALHVGRRRHRGPRPAAAATPEGAAASAGRAGGAEPSARRASRWRALRGAGGRRRPRARRCGTPAASSSAACSRFRSSRRMPCAFPLHAARERLDRRESRSAASRATAASCAATRSASRRRSSGTPSPVRADTMASGTRGIRPPPAGAPCPSATRRHPSAASRSAWLRTTAIARRVCRQRPQVAVVQRGVRVLLRLDDPEDEVRERDDPLRLEAVRGLDGVEVGEVEEDEPAEAVRRRRGGGGRSRASRAARRLPPPRPPPVRPRSWAGVGRRRRAQCR